DLLEERGGGDGATHLGTLGHVAREEVELVERRGVLDRALALHALLRAALPLLLGEAALAARALAWLALHGAVRVPLRDDDQLARAEELLVHLAEGDVVGVLRVEERGTGRRVADLEEVLEVEPEGEERNQPHRHRRPPPAAREPDEAVLDGEVEAAEDGAEDVGEAGDGE